MRLVGQIPHPLCRISLFAWNQKFLVKLELGDLEQTFKIPQLDLATEAELRSAVTPQFIERAIERFASMQRDLQDFF
jgi:predicted secreted protein